MSVLVKVRNFQSIKEAEILIDGLVVTTGPNNSGKTALMRAIRGVFTNPPAGPLVRLGEAYLSVELIFGDGTSIRWEKGWEKPYQKGAPINRYFINGFEIAKVGRGVPPEVENLGVRSIVASTEQVWPQIAQQFEGTLFLVNRPGSSVAEALSDVEKVGRLTTSLKLSEKDRRATQSELEIRRKDVLELKQDLGKYKGLENLEALPALLQKNLEVVTEQGVEITLHTVLRDRYISSLEKTEALKGFEVGCVPPATRAHTLKEQESALISSRELSKRLKAATLEIEELKGFNLTVPDPTRVLKIKELVSRCESLQTRLDSSKKKVEGYSGMSIPMFPSSEPIEDLGTRIKAVQSLKDRLNKAQLELKNLNSLYETTQSGLTETLGTVTELLGDRGECPTCGTLHEKGIHP